MPRTIFWLTVLALASCKGGSSSNDNTGRVVPNVDIPTSWSASEGRIVMRLTDASSTDTEVRRALGRLFNGIPGDPERPGIDPLQLLMRGAPRAEDGSWAPPRDASEAELLAGTALEQAMAFKARVYDAEETFGGSEAVDACGNPVLMTLVSPEALGSLFPDLVGTPLWPEGCATPEGCEPAFGTWDVAIGERRPDGMIDMVLNLLPVFETDPIQPGVFGRITGLFFTDDTPGAAIVPMVMNMRRLQINLTNVWQLYSEYDDPRGHAEVYVFPHRPRTMDMADIFVFPETYADGEAYWEASGETGPVPWGLDQGAVAVDVDAPAGFELLNVTGRSSLLIPTLSDLLVYTLSASLACPVVTEDAWIREGPIEFFLCADGDIPGCLARQDMDEGACLYPTEPEPSLLDPFPVSFERYAIGGTAVAIPASNMPVYLTGAAVGQIELEVTAGSAFYVQNPAVLQAVVGPAGPVELPEPSSNGHCPTAEQHKYAVGDAWAPGTYTLTIDTSATVPADPDGEAETWFYFTHPDVWKPN